MPIPASRSRSVKAVTSSAEGSRARSVGSSCRALSSASRLGEHRLIGRDRQEGGRRHVRRRPASDPIAIRISRVDRQKITQPPQPLVPNGQGGRERECGLPKSAKDLEAERGLAGPRRRNEMETVVLEVPLHSAQHARLVRSPAPPEAEPSGRRRDHE